jgi:hypothetical protein
VLKAAAQQQGFRRDQSIENQIIQMVAAWDDGIDPYKAKRVKGLRFLDGEMVNIFRRPRRLASFIAALKTSRKNHRLEGRRSAAKSEAKRRKKGRDRCSGDRFSCRSKTGDKP